MGKTHDQTFEDKTKLSSNLKKKESASMADNSVQTKPFQTFSEIKHIWKRLSITCEIFIMFKLKEKDRCELIRIKISF